jgi:VanZ family protein
MPLPGVIGALLLFSAGTEIGQFLTSTRSPLFADFVIDGSGATIGLVWWWAVVGGE